MRLTDDTRFPHPVLAPGSTDFEDASFDVTFTCEEAAKSGRVTLHYAIDLQQPDIADLVTSGGARVSALVRCLSTYYSSLEPMTFPTGKIEFRDGTLLNQVVVRPIIWLAESMEGWSPKGVPSEYELPINLPRGAIVAFAVESVLTVGKAKLAPFESVFVLRQSDLPGPNAMTVDLDQDKITILAGKNAFEVIDRVRAESATKVVPLSSVYLPAVMEVLDQLRSDGGAYENRRWFTPFQARCDALGINLQSLDLVEDAQKLLDSPLVKLAALVEA